MRELIAGKRVLVTGAAGSIGASICQSLGECSDVSVLGVDIATSGIPVSANIVPVQGDIRRQYELWDIFLDFRPDLVFHAAALKDVPALQTQPLGAVQTNILGTVHVAHAARKAGVERVVLLSTDKAVRPAGVMGATKRVCELFFRQLDSSTTRFIAVRLGNVLGSQGSVLPKFQAQLESGGPLTVTHSAMQRYCLTVQDAVSVILRSASIAQGGEIVVPEMGEPVEILKLANDMLRDYPNVRIAFTGIRPGEKLHEDLWDSNSEEFVRSVAELNIYRHRLHNVWPSIAAMRDFWANGDEAAVVRSLQEFAPTPILDRPLRFLSGEVLPTP